MQLNELKPKTKKKAQKRVGRGGKRGTFSGRGIKGQRARAGHRIRPALRDVIKKIPKLRGYKAKLRPKSLAVLNVGTLDRHFDEDAKITPEALVQKGLVQRAGKFIPEVKILGAGETAKKFFLAGCRFSKSARAKIEKAGGTIT